MAIEINYTIEAGKVSGSVSNLPVTVFISSTSGANDHDLSWFFGVVGSSWGKLVVTDNLANRLYVEVEQWDTINNIAILHVGLGSAQDGMTITISYDASNTPDSTYIGLTGSTPAQTVWDANYQRMMLCSQVPGGAGSIKDSTVNAQHGTPTGCSQQSSDFGACLALNGSTDVVNIPNVSATADWTFEALVYPISTTSGDGIFVADGDGLVFSDGYLAILDANNVAHRGGSVVNSAWVHLAGTSAGKVFVNGADVTVALTNNGWALSGVTMIGQGYSSRRPQMQVRSAGKHDVVRSAQWIAARYLAVVDQLFTVSLSSGGLIRRVLVQNYNLQNAILRNWLEQNYHLTIRAFSVLDQVYGLRMLQTLIQPYSDAARLRAVLDQRYKDAARLRRTLDIRYGDSPKYRAALDQLFNLQEGLRAALGQPYAIAEGKVRATLDQLNDLQDKDVVRMTLDMLYVLAAGEALVQRFNIKVECDGVEHTSISNINIEQDRSQYCMAGDLQLYDEAEFLAYKKYSSEIKVTVDGWVCNLMPEVPRESRQPGITTYVVPFASRTKLLDSPHSRLAGGELTGMASAIVAALAAPFTVDWQLVDWLIPPGRLSVNEGDPAITPIRRIVESVGGVIQTSPSGVLVCEPEYPVSVNNWDSATPSYYLTDQDDFFQVDSSPELRLGYNIFQISDQQLSAAGESLETITITPTKSEVRVYQVPWDSSCKINLQHSGDPSRVTVVAEGVRQETVASERQQNSVPVEQLEIVAGAGRTSKPFYVLNSYDYRAADLGVVTVAEDGTVTTEKAENSLLHLSYQTKYWSFTVTDYTTEDVQFFPEVVDA